MTAWDVLVAAEPRLSELEDRARNIGEGAGADRHWCASEAWYRFLVPEVVSVVGRDRSAHHSEEAAEEMLRSRQSYELVRAHLRTLLPDCRHEGECLW